MAPWEEYQAAAVADPTATPSLKPWEEYAAAEPVAATGEGDGFLAKINAMLGRARESAQPYIPEQLSTQEQLGMEQQFSEEHPYIYGAGAAISDFIPKSWEDVKHMATLPQPSKFETQDLPASEQLAESWRGEHGPIEQARSIVGTALQAAPLLHLPFAETPLRPSPADLSLVDRIKQAQAPQAPPEIPPLLARPEEPTLAERITQPRVEPAAPEVPQEPIAPVTPETPPEAPASAPVQVPEAAPNRQDLINQEVQRYQTDYLETAKRFDEHAAAATDPEVKTEMQKIADQHRAEAERAATPEFIQTFIEPNLPDESAPPPVTPAQSPEAAVLARRKGILDRKAELEARAANGEQVDAQLAAVQADLLDPSNPVVHAPPETPAGQVVPPEKVQPGEFAEPGYTALPTEPVAAPEPYTPEAAAARTAQPVAGGGHPLSGRTYFRGTHPQQAGRGDTFYSADRSTAEEYSAHGEVPTTGKVTEVKGESLPGRLYEATSKEELASDLGIKGDIYGSDFDLKVKSKLQPQGYQGVRYSEGTSLGEEIQTPQEEVHIFGEAAAARAAPPQKPSKIGQSIEAKAVEAKLTKGFPETAGYDPITIKDQAARASNLVENNPAHARSIVRGEVPLPADVKGTALITAMEEHLLRNPDAHVAHELANSKLVSLTSEAAQEMRLMSERVPDGITTKFAEIKAAREAGAKLRKETPAKIKKDITNEVVKQASKRPTWEQFVRDIEC